MVATHFTLVDVPTRLIHCVFPRRCCPPPTDEAHSAHRNHAPVFYASSPSLIKVFIDSHSILILRNLYRWKPLRIYMNSGGELRIDAHAYARMAVRLSDAEKQTIEARAQLAWSRCQQSSLGVVAMDLKTRRMTDGAGVSSNGNLVIAIVRNGVCETVMLRRDSQEVSKNSLRTLAVKWVGVAKRATGGKARHSRRSHRRY